MTGHGGTTRGLRASGEDTELALSGESRRRTGPSTPSAAIITRTGASAGRGVSTSRCGATGDDRRQDRRGRVDGRGRGGRPGGRPRVGDGRASPVLVVDEIDGTTRSRSPPEPRPPARPPRSPRRSPPTKSEREVVAARTRTRPRCRRTQPGDERPRRSPRHRSARGVGPAPSRRGRDTSREDRHAEEEPDQKTLIRLRGTRAAVAGLDPYRRVSAGSRSARPPSRACRQPGIR